MITPIILKGRYNMLLLVLYSNESYESRIFFFCPLNSRSKALKSYMKGARIEIKTKGKATTDIYHFCSWKSILLVKGCRLCYDDGQNYSFCIV